MQITLIPSGNLIPGHDIEGSPWGLMRENQNKVFSHSGALVHGLPGPFYRPSSTLGVNNAFPGGRKLDTWNPCFRMTRPLTTGAAFTLQAFGSLFHLEITVRRVLPASTPVLGTYALTRASTSLDWSSVDFVIPGVVESDILTFSAMARMEGASGTAIINQFLLREKIAIDAEIP